MENEKGRGAKLVLLVTLLSMLMVVTLATSWPWWWEFTHHMLTNLMLTPAGKRQGFAFVTTLFPGHPLPPEGCGSFHPHYIQQQGCSRPSRPACPFPSALHSRSMNLRFPLTLLDHIWEGSGETASMVRLEWLWCDPHKPGMLFRFSAGTSLYLSVVFFIGSKM